MRAEISVQRFHSEPRLDHPSPCGKSYRQTYTLEAGRGMTLLSALLKIKADIDGTLTFRASCRAAICGSCLMQVNGTQKLACRVSLQEEFERHGQIHVAPMAHMGIIKDLIVEMNPFWNKIQAVSPYVISKTDSAASTEKALAGMHDHLHHADDCIMCGACLSACQSFAVSRDFLGPAALAKAYRLHVDPRDTQKTQRLEKLQGPGGIWDCVRCNLCVSVCPKNVAPMEQIIRLRHDTLQAGLTQTLGARHITEFTHVVGTQGRLNETWLPLRITGRHLRTLLRLLPLGLRMFIHRKTMLPFKRWPCTADVIAIFKKHARTRYSGHTV